MPRKEMTDEQKEQARHNLAKARAARKAKLDKKEVKEEVQEAVAQDPNANIAAIVAAVMTAMEQNKQSEPPQGNTITLGSLEKSDYEDPRDRLYDLPELRRFAMRENFVMKWGLELLQYQKTDGLWYREPKFILELHRHPTDQEIAESVERGGQLNKDVLIFEKRIILMDDDVAARNAAEKLGYKVGVDFDDVESFMTEMRFQVIKKWLLDSLIPPAADAQAANAPKELVVGGTVKQVHDLGGGAVMVESEKIIR